MTDTPRTRAFARLKPLAPRWAVRAFYRLVVPPTTARRAGNAWLRQHAAGVEGDVLSIGSGHDRDKEGGRYRDYFARAASYTTSEIDPAAGCDLVLDVRSMPEVRDAAYDCVYASCVLEHVDDVGAAVAEITRVLKPGGTLLVCLPFREAIHGAPHDYWRFTEHGIRWLLRADYDILRLDPIDPRGPGFPAAYWTLARRRG